MLFLMKSNYDLVCMYTYFFHLKTFFNFATKHLQSFHIYFLLYLLILLALFPGLSPVSEATVAIQLI